MAKPEERKIFKIGDQTYLYDDFANFYNTHKQSYYDYAREYGGFSNEQVAQLDAAIQKALNHAKSSGDFDTTGDFEGNETQNITVTRKKIGKDKQIQQGLTGKNSWLSNFIAKAGQHMKVREKPEDPSKWNWDKHNFGAFLKGNNQDAEQIFSDFDRRDPNNPNKSRTHSERLDLLLRYLEDHQKFINDNNFIFNENNNIYDDDYGVTLENLINYMSDLNPETGKRTLKDNLNFGTVATYLNKLGAGGDGKYNYTRGFTSDQYEYLTEEEKAAKEKAEKEAKEKAEREAEEQAEREAESFRSGHEKTFYDQSLAEFNKLGNIYYGNFSPDKYDQEDYEDYWEYYGDISDREFESDNENYRGEKITTDNMQKLWDTFIYNLQNNIIDNNKNTKDLIHIVLSRDPGQFTELNDGTFLINGSYNKNGRAAVVNPNTGNIKYIFLGNQDYYNNNEKIRNIYNELLHSYLKTELGDDYEKYYEPVDNTIYLNKSGGKFITKHQNGNSLNLDAYHDTRTERRAEENNISVKTQKAKEKYINSDNKSSSNPDAGLTAVEKARLATAALDLTSVATAFIPGYGTAASAALGITSTISNFGFDLFDDAVTNGEMWSNLGLNLGMDLVGLIPGGGAASKAGKIIKNVGKVAGKVLLVPGVISLFKQAPEIKKSWDKAFSEDGKLEYQDYLNLIQVLNVATGMTNIGLNVHHARKQNAIDNDKVAVSVKNKNNENKTLLFTGKDAVEFKKAAENGIEGAQNFINKVEGGNNFTIRTRQEIVDRKKFFSRTDGKWRPWAPIYENVPITQTVYKNEFPVKFFGFSPEKTYVPSEKPFKSDIFGDDLIDFSKRPKTSEVLKTHQQAKNDELSSTLEKSKNYEKNRQRGKSLVDELNERIEKENASINTNETELNKHKKAIDNYNKSDLGKIKSNISKLESEIKSIEIKERKKLDVATQVSLFTQRKQKEQQLNDLKSQLEIIKNTKYTNKGLKSYKTRIDKAKKSYKELREKIKQFEQNKEIWENRKTKINDRIPQEHSAEFNTALKVEPTKVTINGIEHDVMPTKFKLDGSEYDFDKNNWNKEFLENLGLYQQGGSINRNKLNKFLNYGKR